MTGERREKYKWQRVFLTSVGSKTHSESPTARTAHAASLTLVKITVGLLFHWFYLLFFQKQRDVSSSYTTFLLHLLFAKHTAAESSSV